MIGDKRVLAVITARGKSQRLPGKNVRLFCGKPLIAWTIECAKKSRWVDEVVLSTDDLKIARIAARWGVDRFVRRPASLATARAKSPDAVLHVMKQSEQMGKEAAIVVLLQPTSPLRQARDIDGALEMLVSRRADAVVSVNPVEPSTRYVNTLSPDLKLENFFPRRTARKGPYYRLNGAVYVAYWNFFKKRRDWYSPRTYAYVMPPERSVDIDDEMDFIIASAIYTKIKRSRDGA